MCFTSDTQRSRIVIRRGESMSPTAQKIHDRRWWTLLILSASLLVISLDNTILNVALPTIERDLDAGSGQLQWIVDSYTLVFAGLLLTMGALGDRFSRRAALVCGLVVFGAGSLTSAFATSADMLIASRAVMGLGCALIMPTTLSILRNVLSAAGLGLLTAAIIEAPERGWTDGIILGGFAAAAAILAGFVVWELRTATPMLDVRLFRIRRFTGASLSLGLVFFALFGAIFFLTQYLQGVLDYTPLEAGVRMLPVAGGLIVAGPLSAKLAGRLGARTVVTAGLGIVAAALFLLSGAETTSGYSLVAASLVLLGFGMGATMAPATESIMSSVPLNHAGVGSAMNDTVRMVGGTLGVAILGSLLSSSYGADMEPAVKSLPEPAADAASDSLGHASVVADGIGGGPGQALSDAAETAFTTAMSNTLTVAAAPPPGGALVALAVLPGQRRERAEKHAAAMQRE